MATELTVFTPIPPPDRRRPGTLPSLPAWAERLTGAVRIELQQTETGSFADILTLPSAMLPNEIQRQAMMAHQDSLRSFLQDTPANSAAAEARLATAVSKLLTVLAGERKSDLVEEARSEVYLDVLDDVPCWAAEAAARRWFRHDCGTDERGKAYNYTFPPDPGTLRKIALQDVYALGARIGTVQRILDARPYVDCSKQLEDGRLAMKGLSLRKAEGRLDEPLTFEGAIELGRMADAKSEEIARILLGDSAHG